MNVLDSIIEGVREDLAARRVSLSQILEKVETAPPVIEVNFPLDRTSELQKSSASHPAKVISHRLQNPLN
mgnify:CR=1 FL=1